MTFIAIFALAFIATAFFSAIAGLIPGLGRFQSVVAGMAVGALGAFMGWAIVPTMLGALTFSLFVTITSFVFDYAMRGIYAQLVSAAIRAETAK